MSDSLFIPAGTGAGTIFDPLRSRADGVIQRATAETDENRKIDRSAKEFESLLLANWLQHAYQSFGTVPGGDGESDLDSGHDQIQALAMQSLGEAIGAAGGIGIARLIAGQLHKAQDAHAEAASSANRTPESRAAEKEISTNSDNH